MWPRCFWGRVQHWTLQMVYVSLHVSLYLSLYLSLYDVTQMLLRPGAAQDLTDLALLEPFSSHITSFRVCLVCVCLCMSAYVCVCPCLSCSMCVYVCVSVFLCLCMSVHVCVCLALCVYVCMLVYVCVYFLSVCMFVYVSGCWICTNKHQSLSTISLSCMLSMMMWHEWWVIMWYVVIKSVPINTNLSQVWWWCDMSDEWWCDMRLLNQYQ